MNLDTKTKVLLVTAVALLAVGISALTYTQRPGKSTVPSATPTATSSSTAPATPRPDKTDSGISSYPEEVDKAARAAVLAYTQYSWRDPGPLAWLHRLAPLCTPEFEHALEETFGNDGAAQRAWDTDIRPSRRETRTEVTGVQPSGLHEQSAERFTLVVTYLTAVRTQAFDWTTPAEELSQFVTLIKTPAGWKVTDMTSTTDRSGSPT